MMRFKLSLTALMLIVLVSMGGCTRRVEDPEHSAYPTQHPSAEITQPYNDSFEGGGAGGVEEDGSRPVEPELDNNGISDLMDEVGKAIHEAERAIEE